MLKYAVCVLILAASALAQAHNLDENDISTCSNKQFLVKLWHSNLNFEQQKQLVLKSAKAVGLKDGDVSFVGNGFTPGKEFVVTLNHQRNVAQVNKATEAARFSQFKQMVDKVNSQHEVSYAECNVVWDGH